MSHGTGQGAGDKPDDGHALGMELKLGIYIGLGLAMGQYLELG